MRGSKLAAQIESELKREEYLKKKAERIKQDKKKEEQNSIK